MKKIFAVMTAAACALGAYAEGYQVNSFSAKQTGMGHVGVAMKLGAESQIFNPGALGFFDKTFEVSGAVTAISSHVKCFHNGETFNSNNKVSTPMNVSAAFRIYDNLYAGVTFYTPYGSSINWGKFWPGAVLNQSVDLKVFTVQPTVAWRPLPNLSVGAGVMIAWGSVNLNKGLVTGTSMDQLMNLQYEAARLQWNVAKLQQLAGGADPGAAPEASSFRYGHTPPASVNLKGNSALAVGFNVGAMWDINKQWTVGASYRSKMDMHVKAGNAELEYANEQAAAVLGSTLNVISNANFDASMPCPYILTAGVSYKPIPKLLLAFDAQLNGWKTYKRLDIDFSGLDAPFDQHITKDYHNAMTYHVGAQYAVTDRFDVRAGVMIDTNPCNEEYYNPETPGTTKVEPSVGLSFRPVKGLSVDVAVMYVNGARKNNMSVPYDNMLAPSYNAGVNSYNSGVEQFNQVRQQLGLPAYDAAHFEPMPASDRFTADYKLHAWIPAIGISYSF